MQTFPDQQGLSSEEQSQMNSLLSRVDILMKQANMGNSDTARVFRKGIETAASNILGTKMSADDLCNYASEERSPFLLATHKFRNDVADEAEYEFYGRIDSIVKPYETEHPASVNQAVINAVLNAEWDGITRLTTLNMRALRLFTALEEEKNWLPAHSALRQQWNGLTAHKTDEAWEAFALSNKGAKEARTLLENTGVTIISKFDRLRHLPFRDQALAVANRAVALIQWQGVFRDEAQREGSDSIDFYLVHFRSFIRHNTQDVILLHVYRLHQICQAVANTCAPDEDHHSGPQYGSPPPPPPAPRRAPPVAPTQRKAPTRDAASSSSTAGPSDTSPESTQRRGGFTPQGLLKRSKDIRHRIFKKHDRNEEGQ